MSALAALLLAAGTPTLEVTLSSGADEVFLSVHAEAVSAAELLAEIAFRTGRRIESAEPLPDQALTVDLVRRPLDQVVHFVSGAAGLRGRLTAAAIVVQPDLPLGAGPDELDQAAEVQYLRALRRFPDHALAAGAELTLGRIQEDPGPRRRATTTTCSSSATAARRSRPRRCGARAACSRSWAAGARPGPSSARSSTAPRRTPTASRRASSSRASASSSATRSRRST
jgi:hypothetical protein